VHFSNLNCIDKQFLPSKKDFRRNPSSPTDVMPAKAGIQLHINTALISGWRNTSLYSTLRASLRLSKIAPGDFVRLSPE
jgi:hypothetical protein